MLETGASLSVLSTILDIVPECGQSRGNARREMKEMKGGVENEQQNTFAKMTLFLFRCRRYAGCWSHLNVVCMYM